MKRALVVAIFVTMVGVASAQMAAPCLNAGSQTSQLFTREPVKRMASVPDDRLAPMLSYSSYSVGGSRRFGPSMVLQATLFHAPREAIDVFGGVMIRFRDTSQPNDVRGFSPLGLRPEQYPESPGSFLRGLRFGMGFAGLEYTWYLTETDIRPYVGAGGMIMMWPYYGEIAGSVAPTVKAGVLTNMTSGFSGFAEINMTGVAFGIAFAPNWN
jgi:hypothetical protein